MADFDDAGITYESRFRLDDAQKDHEDAVAIAASIAARNSVTRRVGMYERTESGLFLAPDSFSLRTSNENRKRWVRLIQGKYAGDLAWSDPTSTSTEWMLWLVPRLEIPPSKKRGKGPIPARALSFDFLKEKGQEPILQSAGLYSWNGHVFRNGLMQYRAPLSNIRFPLITTRDEVLAFRGSFITKDDYDLITRRCSSFDFEVGMRVLVDSGEQQGLVGFIQDLNEDYATLRVWQKPGHSHSVSIPLQQLQRVWKLGDEVRVKGGPDAGAVGRVLAIDGVEREV